MNRALVTAGKKLIETRARWQELNSYAFKQVQQIINLKLTAEWFHYPVEERPEEHADLDTEKFVQLYGQITDLGAKLSDIISQMQQQYAKMNLALDPVLDALDKPTRLTRSPAPAPMRQAQPTLSAPHMAKMEKSLLKMYEKELALKRQLLVAILGHAEHLDQHHEEFMIPLVSNRQQALTVLSTWELQPYLEDDLISELDDAWRLVLVPVKR